MNIKLTYLIPLLHQTNMWRVAFVKVSTLVHELTCRLAKVSPRLRVTKRVSLCFKKRFQFVEFLIFVSRSCSTWVSMGTKKKAHGPLRPP